MPPQHQRTYCGGGDRKATSSSLRCAWCHPRVAVKRRGGEGKPEHHRTDLRQRSLPAPSQKGRVQTSFGGFRQPFSRRVQRAPRHNEAYHCNDGEERERGDPPATDIGIVGRNSRRHCNGIPPSPCRTPDGDPRLVHAMSSA